MFRWRQLSLLAFILFGTFAMANDAVKVELFDTKSSINTEQSDYLLSYVLNPVALTVDEAVMNDIVTKKYGSIELELPLGDGSSLELELERFEILSPNAQFEATGDNGRRSFAARKSFVGYRGTVGDDDQSLATISFSSLGAKVFITYEGQEYVVASVEKYAGFADNEYVLYRTDELLLSNEFTCGTELFDIPANIQKLMEDTRGQVPRGSVADELLECEVALESDYDTYDHFGGVTGVSDYLMSLFLVVSAVYIRDINTVVTIPYVHIWETASDPYSGGTSLDLLVQFRNHWNSNFSSVSRDIAHFITTRSPGNLGGIAYVDVLCASTSNGFGYAFSNVNGNFAPFPIDSWDTGVVAHEMGHNFGSPHTHSCSWSPRIDTCVVIDENAACADEPRPITGTIMSYCNTTTLDFHPQVIDLIRFEAEIHSCIDAFDSDLIVAVPNGGETYNTEAGVSVVWGSGIDGNLDIEYSIDNGSNWALAASGISAADGSYTWETPPVATTDLALVRVISQDNPSIIDQSDAPFTINAAIQAYSLLSPGNFATIEIQENDPNSQDFIWEQGGSVMGVEYEMELSIMIAGIPTLSRLSDEMGADTVATLTKATIDSFLTAHDAWTGNDSVQVRWKVVAALEDEELSSSNVHFAFMKRGGATSIDDDEIAGLPSEFKIDQNYPNPFNPSTRIAYELPQRSDVTIKVYNTLGSEVATLVSGTQPAGRYETTWNATDAQRRKVQSGIYFYRIEAGSFVETRKMILLK